MCRMTSHCKLFYKNRLPLTCQSFSEHVLKDLKTNTYTTILLSMPGKHILYVPIYGMSDVLCQKYMDIILITFWCMQASILFWLSLPTILYTEDTAYEQKGRSSRCNDMKYCVPIICKLHATVGHLYGQLQYILKVKRWFWTQPYLFLNYLFVMTDMVLHEHTIYCHRSNILVISYHRFLCLFLCAFLT